jgi:glycosyltransferase involved in cell wall biosynthesis
MLRRVLCLDQFPWIGGAQQSFLELIPALRQQGSEVEMILPGPGPYASKLHAAGCGLQYFKTWSLSAKSKKLWEVIPYWAALRHARRVVNERIREFEPDLLYVNGPRFLPAVSESACAADVPVLFHAHNRLAQKPALALAGNALQKCDATLIACCEYVAGSFRRYLPPSRVNVIYNGSTDLGVLSRPQRPIRTISVLGRIAPEKGQLNFVHAAKLLSAANPGLRFTIVGSASEDNVGYASEVLRASSGLNVEVQGWQEDMASVFRGIDLLVVPSLAYDAAPRVIAEAFSARVPVMACPSGGIPELIEDGRTGFLTAGHSPHHIAERVSDVMSMPLPALKHIVEDARGVWEARFTLEHYRNRVWNVAKSCVQQPLARAV